MTAAGRDVESINEEAVEAAAIALYEDGRGDDYKGDPAYDWPNIDSGYDWDGDFDDDGNPVDQSPEWLRDRYRSEVRTVLAAAVPLLRLSDVPGLERQLRDKIAGEIEADVAAVNWAPTFCNGMEWAALIARRGVDAALNIARGQVSS